MGDVTSINEYFLKSNVVGATPGNASYSTSTGLGGSSDSFIANLGPSLNAAVLRKIDPDATLGKFLDLTRQAIEKMDECIAFLDQGKNLDADDKFMATKPMFAEIFMHRDLSDPVGLIALSCIQASSKVLAVTDAPSALTEIRHALNRLWAAPFMSFMEASNLSDKILSFASSLPGYNEVALELIGDSDVAKSSPT